MGAALRPRNSAPIATAAPTDQRQLAGGRDLHPVKGKWVYLYRAVDSTGATIDFLLSAKRDAAAAERFLVKALGGENHPAPRVINTDEHAGYPPAIMRLKAEETLEENCRHRPVQYLNNVLEQDHRAIKRRVRASQHFRSGSAASAKTVYYTGSFSVCSLRRTKFTIVHPDFRFDGST